MHVQGGQGQCPLTTYLHATFVQVVTETGDPPACIVIEATEAVDGQVNALVEGAVDPVGLQPLWERRALGALDAVLSKQLLLHALYLDVVARGLALVRAGKAHMPLDKGWTTNALYYEAVH